MENPFYKEQEKFSSPKEEIDFLREKLQSKEKEMADSGARAGEAEPTREVVRDYASQKPADVLSPGYAMSESKAEQIVLALKPEAHDKKMEELLGILLEHGVKNALSIVEKLGSPHIDDDFHRLLVQYLQSGGVMPGLEKDTGLQKALHMKLFEIIFPEGEKEAEDKDFKKIIAVMEQFYAGMLSISDGRDNLPGKNYFTLEISIANNSDEIVFYSAVPADKGDLLEKQLLALYPKARIREIKDDYNIFNDAGASTGAYGEFTESQVYPIKTYDAFDNDPLPVILNVFSKLKKEGEGAAIQFVITPVGDYFLKKYGAVLDQIKRGVPVKEATNISWGFGGALMKEVSGLFFGSGIKKKKEGENDEKKIDENVIKHLSDKIGNTIMNANIRVIASAESTERAEKIISDLESAFNQFALPQSNAITFTTEKRRSGLRKLFHEFSYRTFSYDHPMPLNLREFSTVFHFPGNEETVGQSQLKQGKTASAAAPLDMPKEGILLGINKYRNLDTPIYLTPDDRLRHLYVVGQTGTGKTTLLKNMIVQDIEAGRGVCMIDPHGTDIVDILANIPKERMNDVIYFDPSDIERPMGLNMLEYDPRFPEQKTFVVNELLAIFNKLFDMKVAGGPAFEQYFRNSALLVMDHPESGNTLLDIGRVLADKEFRAMKIRNCKNPLIVQFWENAVKTTGDQSLANYVPYITNKFDVFLSNDIMRPIVSQEHSVFNFRDIMDNRKIFLVNLSKGRLGDINSSLLGLILVGKILMAALSRVDSIGTRDVADFFLYIDEFQNVTTDSIATILSEARKYRLSLNIAHQYVKQLEEDIKNAVFGNVGSMVVFRVGSEDAEVLSRQFEPVFVAHDIINLENRNAYVKMLV
ncbi:MAG: DUF87 domain-containing protein, partial [Candidatus Paceibacterota bacterium]